LKNNIQTISVKRARYIDKAAQMKYGICSKVLMENAGLRTAELALKILKDNRKKKIFVLFAVKAITQVTVLLQQDI